MQRLNQYFSQLVIMGLLAIAIGNPAQAGTPRQGDADRLRPKQGAPISPTNGDQFSPELGIPSSEIKIRNIKLEVTPIEPVIPGNYNATPQKVNRSGNFSSDPLNAIPIFQESSRVRRR